MPIKRAIWISVVAYVATFILGIVFGLFFGFGTAPDLSDIPAAALYSGAVAAIVVIGLAAWWFFKSPKAVPTTRHGLYFGLISIAVGFTLDFVTVLPFGNPIELLGAYYVEPFFAVTLLLILGTTTAVGHFLEKKLSKDAAPTQEV